MTPIKYLIALFILAVISQLPQQEAEPKKCERLGRVKIEELFGRPDKCPKEVKNVECFGEQRPPHRWVRFNESGVVEQIDLSDPCSHFDSLKKDLDRTLPEKFRGKFLGKPGITFKGSPRVVEEEDYECVKIKYTQDNSMGCPQAWMTIVWK